MWLLSVPWGAGPGGRMRSGYGPLQNWVLTGDSSGWLLHVGQWNCRLAGEWGGVRPHRTWPADTPGPRGASPSTGKGRKNMAPAPCTACPPAPCTTCPPFAVHPPHTPFAPGAPHPLNKVPLTPYSTSVPRSPCPRTGMLPAATPFFTALFTFDVPLAIKYLD